MSCFGKNITLNFRSIIILYESLLEESKRKSKRHFQNERSKGIKEIQKT